MLRKTECSRILTKDLLQEEYLSNNKSLNEIGKEFGFCRQTILNYMKKFNIKRRTNSETNSGKLNCGYIDGRSKTKVYCIDCGNELGKYAYYNKTKRCGRCYHNYSQGKNHGNWKGGKSYEPYSSKFNNRLKEKIRQRDNHTCQLCGLTEKENKNFYKHKLNVHHIDYDKQNCKENNLITLCNSCHMKTHYNREEWIKLFLKKIIRR